MEIRRGDVFLVNFNPARGSEQAGYRPALIILNNAGNNFSSTTIVAAITTSVQKIYPFLPGLEAGEGGLTKDSAVNLAQILTVDNTRLEQRLGSLPEHKMFLVDRAIKISLNLV